MQVYMLVVFIIIIRQWMHFLVIRWNIGFLWPYVTTCDFMWQCDHGWWVWPYVTHVTSVTTGDKSDYMWQLCHGHLDIMDLRTSWTFGHLDIVDKYLDIMDKYLDRKKEHIWKFFPMNIWNIVGRRYLRTFFCFALKEWHYQCSIIFDQPCFNPIYSLS